MNKIILPEAKFYPVAVPDKWDNIEISGIYDDGESNCEPTDIPEEISYYSVYLHDVNGGVQCIADFPTKPETLVFVELLKKSVLNYKNNGFLTPTINDVEFSIERLPEDTKPEDEMDDLEAINFILDDYNNGNLWAWCIVKVTAKWKGLEGFDYLGGCSYKDEGDFKQNDYYEEMKKAAFDNLISQIESLR